MSFRGKSDPHFPSEGSNTDFLHLLHWQADSLPLDYLGNPANSVFLSSKSAVCKLHVSSCCYVVFVYLLSLNLFLSSNNNPFPGYPIFIGKSFQQCGYVNKPYCLSLLFVLCLISSSLQESQSDKPMASGVSRSEFESLLHHLQTVQSCSSY